MAGAVFGECHSHSYVNDNLFGRCRRRVGAL